MTWEQVPEEYRNGLIMGYNIQIASLDDLGNPIKRILNFNCTSLTFYGLKKFTTYMISIQAFTRKGCGTPGNYTIETETGGK